MSRSRIWFPLLGVAGGLTALLLLSKPLWQADEPLLGQGPPPTFIQVIEGETNAQLQTSITSYRSPDGIQVALIGAVHVADAAYYQELNERFADYDTILYELVGDPDDLLSNKSEEGPSGIRMLQRSLMRILDLTFQLDGIDYTAPHFVHADLNKEEFAQRQKARGESFFTIVQRAARAQLESEDGQPMSGQIDPWQLMKALFSKDRSDRLKLIIAEQFTQSDQLFAAIEGEEGSVIISERNARVIEVMQEEQAKGKRNLAVFYGAGHLLDLDQRLIGLGFKRGAHEWLTAWNISKPQKASKD